MSSLGSTATALSIGSSQQGLHPNVGLARGRGPQAPRKAQLGSACLLLEPLVASCPFLQTSRQDVSTSSTHDPRQGSSIKKLSKALFCCAAACLLREVLSHWHHILNPGSTKSQDSIVIGEPVTTPFSFHAWRLREAGSDVSTSPESATAAVDILGCFVFFKLHLVPTHTHTHTPAAVHHYYHYLKYLSFHNNYTYNYKLQDTTSSTFRSRAESVVLVVPCPTTSSSRSSEDTSSTWG